MRNENLRTGIQGQKIYTNIIKNGVQDGSEPMDGKEQEKIRKETRRMKENLEDKGIFFHQE